jgi:hypothetical protein
VEETKRLRNSIDSIKEWLDAECEMDPGYSEQASIAYTSYAEFMKKQQRRPQKTTDFKKVLEARGFRWRKTKVSNVYQGFRITEQ